MAMIRISDEHAYNSNLINWMEGKLLGIVLLSVI
jgi:hypothetical protein